MKIETKKDLRVASSFTEKFGNKGITPAKTVPSFRKLERNMYDHEIKSEFGVKESTLQDVAAFLKNPPKGCDDGYANLFYVSGCVVDVDWGTFDWEWHVNVLANSGRWLAGNRVFSRNWLSEPLVSSDTMALSTLVARVENLEAVIKHHIEEETQLGGVELYQNTSDDWEEALGEIVRDMTSVGYGVKSQVKQRLKEIIAQERTRAYGEGVKDGEGTKHGVERYQMGHRDGVQEERERIAEKVKKMNFYLLKE